MSGIDQEKRLCPCYTSLGHLTQRHTDPRWPSIRLQPASSSSCARWFFQKILDCPSFRQWMHTQLSINIFRLVEICAAHMSAIVETAIAGPVRSNLVAEPGPTITVSERGPSFKYGSWLQSTALRGPIRYHSCRPISDGSLSLEFSKPCHQIEVPF